MSVTEPVVEERTRAVIISGPRTGEIIHLPLEEPNLTPEEEALLDSAVRSFRRAAVSACHVTAEMQSLLEDLRKVRVK
jgi:hypothetical protein